MTLIIVGGTIKTYFIREPLNLPINLKHPEETWHYIIMIHGQSNIKHDTILHGKFKEHNVTEFHSYETITSI